MEVYIQKNTPLLRKIYYNHNESKNVINYNKFYVDDRRPLIFIKVCGITEIKK